MISRQIKNLDRRFQTLKRLRKHDLHVNVHRGTFGIDQDQFHNVLTRMNALKIPIHATHLPNARYGTILMESQGIIANNSHYLAILLVDGARWIGTRALL